MKILINREELLIPLNAVCSVVERRQNLPILSNILVEQDEGKIRFTASDLEVESCYEHNKQSTDQLKTTIPARKFLDIIKALPDGSDIEIQIEEENAKILSGKSKFSLSTMPAEEFPNIGEQDEMITLTISERDLKKLVENTQFAMAHQDVRYYLNGLLIELEGKQIRTVATDGHRLAISETMLETDNEELKQIIVPRKGILEMMRFLGDGEKEVKLHIGENYLKIETDIQILTTKLIDGKFPDYERVIPKDNDKKVFADRLKLRSGLARTSILTNEKFKQIRMVFEEGKILTTAKNPEQESAEEEIEVIYTGTQIEIGFNVTYILDVLNIIKSEQVILELKDTDSSCLITAAEDKDSRFVIMPMRL